MLFRILDSVVDHNEAAEDYARIVRHGAKVSWNLRGTWLLQQANRVCDPLLDPNCNMERTKMLIVLTSLLATIVVVGCAFNFFREDREESLTPLCPQLVVKDADLMFRFPMPMTEAQSAKNMDVMDNSDPPKCICKISMDWPDPFRGSPHGVAATVRITKSDMTLATIVARNVAIMGQGLALCRTGCEIFGFVEPVEGNKFYVRHRTGVHLLTLIASGGSASNLDEWDIEAYNPVGAKVCTLKKNGDQCVGKVTQHVDAGLVLCAVMAIHVHRRLNKSREPAVACGQGSQALSAAPLSQERPDATSPVAEEGMQPAVQPVGPTAPVPTSSTRDTRIDCEPTSLQTTTPFAPDLRQPPATS